ncbi:MAG: undecaprenyl-diphosphate phosphatase [Fidelibacterota bacterium]
MTLLEAFFLGILQGVTEFLPISSSGHLVVAENLMGLSHRGILFEVTVHLGTLMSILVVFRRDILRLITHISSRETRSFLGYLLVGTIPIALAGGTLRSSIEPLFENVTAVGLAFLVTGTVLVLTRFIRSGRSGMNGRKSLVVGLAQAISLVPGISRSGVTIGSGIMLGLPSGEAARFSFLLAIPALVGSGALLMGDFLQAASHLDSALVLGAGFVSSFAAGLAALKVLLRILRKGNFHWFGAYCLVLGTVILI